jgi:hypothetical protein
VSTEPLTPLAEPWGLAVNGSGSLYVAEATGQAVDVFSSSGVFQPPQLNDASVEATPFTGPYVRSVAVDDLPGPNHGMVYVAESNGENVDVFKPGAEGKYTLLQERKFSGFMAVAFDSSGGPESGDLYVFANSNLLRVALKPDGTLPEAEEAPGVVPLEAPPEGFGSGASGGIAVGPTGKVFLASPREGAVDIYSNEDALEFERVTGAAVPAGAEPFEPVAVGVDPSSEELYAVDAANHVVDEFSSANGYIGQISDGGALQRPLGLAIDGSGQVYVSDGEANVVDVFGPDLLLPDGATGAASGVGSTSASVSGTANPNGAALTDCRFDYVDQAHYEPAAADPYAAGGSVPCVPSAAEIPVDSEAHSVQANVTGLVPGTTYHFRVDLANANGRELGADATFATLPPPVIDDATAKELTATSATLDAEVNPGGTNTSCQFEYGTTTDYGHIVPCVPQPGSGTVDVPVGHSIEGLDQGATYHWRVVASNLAGTTSGSDHTFVYAFAGEPPRSCLAAVRRRSPKTGRR